MAATGSTTAAIAPPRPSSGSGASPDTSPSEHLRRPNVGRRRCRAPLDLPPHAGREGIAMNGVSGPRYNGRFIALVGCLFAATCLLFAACSAEDGSRATSPAASSPQPPAAPPPGPPIARAPVPLPSDFD